MPTEPTQSQIAAQYSKTKTTLSHIKTLAAQIIIQLDRAALELKNRPPTQANVCMLLQSLIVAAASNKNTIWFNHLSH